MATTRQQVLSLQNPAHSTVQHVSSVATSTSASSDTNPLLTALGVTLAIIIPTLILLCIPLLILSTIRLRSILTRPPPSQRKLITTTQVHRTSQRGHLLILLGSGGHTAEMLSILRNLGREYFDTRFERRTWVVSSGDAFSMAMAREIEREWEGQREEVRGRRADEKGFVGNGSIGRERETRDEEHDDVIWNIVTVRRARRVHQSLLSTPISALGCLWDCMAVLHGTASGMTPHQEQQRKGIEQSDKTSPPRAKTCPYPDLILTNGPGTGVILVLASLILLFLGLAPSKQLASTTTASTSTSMTTNSDLEETRAGTEETQTSQQGRKSAWRERGAMRTIYIESWARVKTMSLSGKILKFLGARMLVQWRGLVGEGGVDLTRVRVSDKEEDVSVKEAGIGSRMGSSYSSSGGAVHSGKEKSVRWPRKMEYVGAVVT